MRGQPLDIPDVGPGAYLLADLFNAGPVKHTAMGDEPRDWDGFRAFAECIGAVLEPWEFKALVDMSLAYLIGRNAGSDGLSIPPSEWEED